MQANRRQISSDFFFTQNKKTTFSKTCLYILWEWKCSLHVIQTSNWLTGTCTAHGISEVHVPERQEPTNRSPGLLLRGRPEAACSRHARKHQSGSPPSQVSFISTGSSPNTDEVLLKSIKTCPSFIGITLDLSSRPISISYLKSQCSHVPKPSIPTSHL